MVREYKEQEEQSLIISRVEEKTALESKSVEKNASDAISDKPQLVLDDLKTIKRLEQNLIIVKFCTNDLKENSQFSRVSMLLMSNFAFLLKMSLLQVVFVSMAMFVVLGLVTLMLIEIGYLAILIIPY